MTFLQYDPWLASDTGLIARIARHIQMQRLHPGRTVVLLPYAQLMGVARAHWIRCHPQGFAPRFESSHNWARSVGGFLAAPGDIAFDRASDLISARALLEQVPFLAARSGSLAGRLVDTALQLAPLAAAQLPAQRADWAQTMRQHMAEGADSDWFNTESALNNIALIWASNSAYVTDGLLEGAAMAQADALIVLQGLQPDPLTQRLAHLFGDAAQCWPLVVEATSALTPITLPRGQIRLHHATEPGEEAERAAACVLRQLAQEAQSVALVAGDRALSRRITALLAAHGVAVHDETGWKLSTTRAAADLSAALAACAHRPSSDAVLAWLKVASAFDDAEVCMLEARLRTLGLRDWPTPERWQMLSTPVQPSDERAVSMAQFVAQVEALRQPMTQRRTLGEWLQALRQLLTDSGQWSGLIQDTAGVALIGALHLDAQVLPPGPRLGLAEFSAWVRDVLEAGSVVLSSEATAQAAVRLLPLHQMLGRSFASAVFAGCDEQRLPSAPEPAGDWSPGQRAGLGLATRESLHRAQQLAWQLLLQLPQVDLLYSHGDAQSDSLRPSPLLLLLQTQQTLPPAPDPRQPQSLVPQPVARPMPQGSLLLPRQLSASAYEDLRHCPYRFFALRQLGLRHQEELDTVLDKRDFGTWMHQVLHFFHLELQQQPDADETLRRQWMDTAAQQATQQLGLSRAEFLPFEAGWPTTRDGYLRWLAQHEVKTGARFEVSEKSCYQPLGELTLAGRLDRVDRLPVQADALQDTGQAWVIDYKTESLERTRRRVADAGEDTQLAFYAALVPDDAPRAAYVNVGEGRNGTHTVEQPDVAVTRDALLEGIAHDWQRMAEGARMAPLGEGQVCEHCDARGLCRKDFWSESANSVVSQPSVSVPSAAATETSSQRPVREVGTAPPIAVRPAYEHNGQPVARERFYALACDPRRSVVVEACAGAGKTWMLVSRILRVLLEEGEAACAPHEILAITFTRKAASEMRGRLDQWLEEFSRADIDALALQLMQRGMDFAAAHAAAPRLPGLYARLLESGRTVQFRTFHAWFAGLLRHAPLAVLEQLQLPAQWQLLEDDAPARDAAWLPFQAQLLDEASLHADYEAQVREWGRSQTTKALAEALSRRVEFMLADEQGVVDAGVQPCAVIDPDFAGLSTPEDWLWSEPRLQALGVAAKHLGGAHAPTFRAKGSELEQAISCCDAAALVQALFTLSGDPRKFSDKIVGIDQVREVQQTVQRYLQADRQHAAWLHQQRMARLTRRLIVVYEQTKRARGWIDMSDVERAARLLLGQPELWGWIAQRLDAGVRQLLVDEFQDTNPLQWQALLGWLGSYAGAVGRRPRLFIVGDPKQSIYRFRGAEPQVFQAAKRFVHEVFDGDLLFCDHTHRNAHAVIGLVNQVMEQAQSTGEFEGFRAHSTESETVGVVGFLPLIERDQASDASSTDWLWRDSLTQPRVLPEEKLLQRECRQAAQWIAQRIAMGCPPQRIMVMARRRSRLTAMQEQLRRLHIAAQQPEKRDLQQAPEVQDVLALIDALVSPQHDLSLARALKSPLFGLDDAALCELVLRQREQPGRSWFDLLQSANLPPPLADVGTTLGRWQDRLRRLPPHDALVMIYHEADVPGRFAAAAPASLRTSVLAQLNGLLACALDLDGGRFLTPYALVRALRAGGQRAPSVMAHDAVQLLTVHGAKGLEADLVLMLDCDAAAPRAQTMGVLVDWPGEAPAPLRFVFLAKESAPSICAQELLAREQAARQREEINALYVAMTRARAELVLSATQAARDNPGSWWQRLTPSCTPLAAANVPTQTEALQARSANLTLMRLPAVPIASLPTTLALQRSWASATAVVTEAALLGQAVHRLIEWVPRASVAQASDWPQRHLGAVAREFGLHGEQAQRAAALALRIRFGAGAWAWDEARLDWQGNEVAIVHDGALLRMDRVVRERARGCWWVLDYKSATHPQQDAALIAQLQGYRVALTRACPGEPVRAAFLTGQGDLVELP